MDILDLKDLIDQRRSNMRLTVHQVAQRAGMSTNTFVNVREGHTRPRDDTLQKIEDALLWDRGTIRKFLDGEPIPEDEVPSPTDQLRKLGRLNTPHGLLTWTEQPGGRRDYTLTRRIDGQERGPSILQSSLPPAEAVEDLKVGLAILEHFYEQMGREPEHPG